jgi:hypothetical protein
MKIFRLFSLQCSRKTLKFQLRFHAPFVINLSLPFNLVSFLGKRCCDLRLVYLSWFLDGTLQQCPAADERWVARESWGSAEVQWPGILPPPSGEYFPPPVGEISAIQKPPAVPSSHPGSSSSRSRCGKLSYVTAVYSSSWSITSCSPIFHLCSTSAQ